MRIAYVDSGASPSKRLPVSKQNYYRRDDHSIGRSQVLLPTLMVRRVFYKIRLRNRVRQNWTTLWYDRQPALEEKVTYQFERFIDNCIALIDLAWVRERGALIMMHGGKSIVASLWLDLSSRGAEKYPSLPRVQGLPTIRPEFLRSNINHLANTAASTTRQRNHRDHQRS